MKILVMNGNAVPSGFDDYLACFTRSVLEHGHEAERIDLRDLKLRYCIGCWSCWLKTPGLCAMKDDMASLYPKIVAADLLVWASPLVLGTISALAKMAQDRMIPIVHPYVEVVDGECHHRQRYAHNPDLGVIVAPGADDSDEDLAIVRASFERFSRNTRTRLRLFATPNTPAQEAAREALAA